MLFLINLNRKEIISVESFTLDINNNIHHQHNGFNFSIMTYGNPYSILNFPFAEDGHRIPKVEDVVMYDDVEKFALYFYNAYIKSISTSMFTENAASEVEIEIDYYKESIINFDVQPIKRFCRLLKIKNLLNDGQNNEDTSNK